MRKIFLILGMCFALLGSAYAQQTVTGKVTDEDGLGIPGVSIQEKNTTNGIVTDVNGDYNLRLTSSDATLVYSFVGMSTIEEDVNGRNSINVTLRTETKSVDEVVVTALGIKREQKSLGYAISSIKADELAQSGNTVNPLSSIYGRAAGVGVAIGSAGPTGSVNIKIRGAGGLRAGANTRPLIVVDGVPIYDEETNMASRGYNPLNSFDYGTGLNDLNSEDIESVEILKGAKAAVLYGSAGANGVFIITTKSGAKTRGLGVTVSYQRTIEQPVNYIDWQNEYGSGTSIYDTAYYTDTNGQKIRQLSTSRFQFGPKFDNSMVRFFDGTMVPYKAYPNNFDDLFSKSNTDIYSFAISGANQKGSMRVGYTNKDYKGFMDNFYQKSNSISFNGQMKASELASFEFVANLYDVKTQNRYPNLGRLVSYGFNRDYDYQALKGLYKDEDGYMTRWEDYGLPASVADGTGYLAMLWEQNENRDNDDKLHITGNFRTTLNFLPWLFVTTSAGIDYTDWNFTTKNKVTRIIPSISGGGYSFRRTNTMVQNFNAFLNFNKKFIDDNLEILAFVGPEYRGVSQNNISTSTQGGLQFPDWYSLSASVGKVNGGHSRSKELLYSVLGSSTISWKNTYYLELQGRKDWSSTLPPENNSFFYPGASLTWIFSENTHIPFLEFGKFRFSWADVGRGTTPYYANQLYSAGKIYNSNVTTMTGPGALFSGQLKPERKREYEMGFDAYWFKGNRLITKFSYYTNNVYDQIMGIPLSGPTGYSEIRVNAGNVKNWGYELELSGTPVLTKDFRWNLSLSASNQRSKTLKLYEGITKQAVSGGGSFGVWAEEGKTFGEIQMYDYLKAPDGKRIVNNNGYYSADDKKLVVAGNINPDFMGGLFSDFEYKSFKFGFGLDYKFGGTFLSYSNYYLLGNGQVKETLKYRDEAHGGLAYYVDNSGKRVKTTHDGTVPSGNTDTRIYHDGLILDGVRQVDGQYVPNDIILTSQEYWSSFIHDMSEWFQPDYLYKNDYIKLRELYVSYTLPSKIVDKMKLQKVVLSLNARNLFFLYKTMPNVDAEGTLGSNVYAEYTYLPSIRSYGFRVDVSF